MFVRTDVEVYSPMFDAEKIGPLLSAPQSAPKPAAAPLAAGLLLTGGIAGLAMALHAIPALGALSPMILAVGMGIAIRRLAGVSPRARPGVMFAMKKVLRLGIILLGLQLTVTQISTLGVTGAIIILSSLIATFLFTKWLGRLMGVDRRLAELIAAGTSICGASAVIAVNTITDASDEDVTYAVACVTVFGSLAMILYPALSGVLHLGPQAFGLWTGASIHEIAQAVAASFQGGAVSGQFGTVAKLTRVLALAPMVFVLGMLPARGGSGDGAQTVAGRAPMPWFVFGFACLVGVNSLWRMPAAFHQGFVLLATFLLAMALAAMGLETDIGKLKAKGLRPLLLGAAAWIFIGGVSLALIKALNYQG
jgi:uncharacterized integral membrane protein (TIGR00698 family)